MKYEAEVKITVEQLKELIAKEFGIDKKSVNFFLSEAGDERNGTYKILGGASFKMTFNNPVAQAIHDLPYHR